MQAIVNAVGMLLAKLVAAVKWIGELFVKVFVAAWDFVQDAACWVFESALKLAITILGGFDFSGLSAALGSWAGLPASTLEVLSAVGFSQALGLVLTACGIRLMLQLIPFTRLGS
jgi:hypothetical protein